MSADFTPIIPDPPAQPSKGSYTDLKPFRFWCQKVLPLVYDESLSYYEVVCKVVDYLNKTMEDVGVLHDDVDSMFSSFQDLTNWTDQQIEAVVTGYGELQSYVNNYFDNLDVQQEINNKLDALVLDGTLTTLVSPFVPDAVSAWLTTHVDPATGYVIDNTLTIAGAAADAKTTGDALKQITNKMQKINPENRLSGTTSGRYMDLSGETGSDVQYVLGNAVDVSEGDHLYFTFAQQAYSAQVRYVTAINANGVAVAAKGATYVDNYTVPQGITKVYVTFTAEQSTKAMVTVNTEPSEYSDYFMPYYAATEDFLLDLIPDINDIKEIKEITDKLELIEPENKISELVTGKYMTLDGQIGSSASYNMTNQIAVNPADSVYFTFGSAASTAQVRYVTAFDQNGNAVEAKGAAWANDYTVPDGVYSIVVTFTAEQSTNAMVTVNTEPAEYQPYFDPYYVATEEFLNDLIPDIETDEITAKMEKITSVNRITAVTSGKYMTLSGETGSNASYVLANAVDVNVGDHLYFTYGNAAYSAQVRFVTAFNAAGEAVEAKGKQWVTSYTVPDDITKVVVTFNSDQSTNPMICLNEVLTQYQPYFDPYYVATEEFLNNLIPDVVNQKITKSMEGLTKYYVDSDTITLNAILSDDAAGICYMYHNPNSGSIGGCAASVDFANERITFYEAFGVFNVANLVEAERRTLSLTPIEGHTYCIQYTRSGITPMYTLKITDLNTLEAQTETKSSDALGNGWGIRGYNLTGMVLSSVDYECNEPQRPKALILGDSYSEGWTIWNQREKRWCYLLKTKLDGDAAINAQGGATAQDLDTWWTSYLTKIFVPAYVIIECGVNGSYSNFETYVTSLCNKIRSYGSVPILCTVPPTTSKPNVADYNNFVLASGYDYIDIAKALTVNGDRTTQNTDLFMSDLIHPNISGHQKIYEMACLNIPQLFRK